MIKGSYIDKKKIFVKHSCEDLCQEYEEHLQLNNKKNHNSIFKIQMKDLNGYFEEKNI